MSGTVASKNRPTPLSKCIGWVLILGSCLLAKAQTLEPPGTLPLSIHILYFDQSSDQLRLGVKTTLDSMARQLTSHPQLMAIITGYADALGKRELNLALSERRARKVENYLEQRGVSASQMKVQWEGSDTKASAEELKALKTISRRVAILLLPR